MSASPPCPDLLVAVQRRPAGLVALVSRVRPPFELPADAPLEPRGRRFEIVEVPLESVSTRVCPARDRVVAAWNACRAARWDAAMRLHLLTLALETTPSPDAVPSSPITPAGAIDPPRPRPTAAHPRAYRGTLRQPPKPRLARVTDLRPQLCSDRGLAEALHLLGGPREEDLRHLAKQGYAPDSLARAAASTGDFGQAYHHHGPRPDRLVLPSRFAAEVFPLLREVPWPEVRRHLALHRALGLESDHALRACVVRLLAVASAASALAWCHLAAQRPAARRAAFVAVVADSAGDSPPLADMEALLARLEACTTDEHYPLRVRGLLRGLAGGAPAEYVIEGIELAGRYDEALVFETIPSCTDYPARGMRDLLSHLEQPMRIMWPGYPLVLWERCGVLPRFSEAIRSTEWHSLDPWTAWNLLNLMTGVVHHDVDQAGCLAKWRFLRQEFPRIVEWVREVPSEHQTKFIEAISTSFHRWDRVEELEKYMPSACAMAARLARPPFEQEDLASWVIAHFIDRLPAVASAAVLGAPDRCYRRLEDEVDGGAFANRRMEGGIWTLADRLPSLVEDGFLRFPGPLLRAAKMLGSVSEPDRARVLAGLEGHPLSAPDFLKRPPSQVLSLLKRHAPAGVNPVPRRLREHVERGGALTRGQMERHLRVLGGRLTRVRIALLEELAVEAMGRGLVLDRRHAALRHALEMLRFAKGNRRGLRKLLAAIADGRPPAEYLLTHPATREWLARHPRVDAATWTRGARFTCDVRGWGRLDLALEQDPLEALKLGTYVGSCLGLGQICAYSAAAVVLDVNKQVVYARDARGHVVARQLVALSEADTLVCFGVYPESAAPDVQAAFLDYDLRFAENLGLPLHEEQTHGTPVIAYILSQEWWDDGVWDLFQSTKE